MEKSTSKCRRFQCQTSICQWIRNTQIRTMTKSLISSLILQNRGGALSLRQLRNSSWSSPLRIRLIKWIIWLTVLLLMPGQARQLQGNCPVSGNIRMITRDRMTLFGRENQNVKKQEWFSGFFSRWEPLDVSESSLVSLLEPRLRLHWWLNFHPIPPIPPKPKKT